MSKFVEVEAGFSVSPQLVASDLDQAATQGFTLIVNNRPDDEESGQPDGADLAAHAKRLGMEWIDIPVTHAGFSAGQVERLGAALKQAEGAVLAYCRSGTRSAMLWALAQARAGRHPAELQDRAAAAGYDLTGLRPLLDQQYAAAAAR
ncbi:TIGR01244 family sulfur transferase [Croceibacterium ferulae]|uniref:TIGR01244 family sulfur transferase n=1 Tax=Croceibacterium ferulae TaxID=1854641 RepID=UPI000EADF261|nr:TIGR01244 family sulfur transferase [Croceibacterium ferulae]